MHIKGKRGPRITRINADGKREKVKEKREDCGYRASGGNKGEGRRE